MKQRQIPKPMKKAHVKPKEEKKPSRRFGARMGEAPTPIAGYDLFDYPAEKKTKKKKTKD